MVRQSSLVQDLKNKITTTLKLLGLGIKKYILQLIDLENQLEKAMKNQTAPKYHLTRQQYIDVMLEGNEYGCPDDYNWADEPSKSTIENKLVEAGFSTKLWEKGNHKRLYITCQTAGYKTDAGDKCGYINLITNQYESQGVKTRLADIIRQLLNK